MHSPLDQFKIKKIVNIVVGGVDLSITNSSAVMLSVAFIVVILCMIGVHKMQVIPSRRQSFLEIISTAIETMVSDNIGFSGKKFVALIFTMFSFIAMSNLLGMFPYVFACTSQIVVSGFLALLIFVISTALGFWKHGLKFFKILLPDGTPKPLIPLVVLIELISYFSKPITLCVRLFANIVAGHSMMEVFASFITSWIGIFPLVMTSVLTGFEIIIGLLQAYIFAILSCIYLRTAIHLH